jgi:Cu-Zn family superoxide dismutase
MNSSVLPAILLTGAVVCSAIRRLEGADVRVEMKSANGRVQAPRRSPETPHGLIVRYTPFNLAKGAHALHLHEAGNCAPPTFKTAGGHFNPAKVSHGFANAKGYHAGDIPNISVGSERESHEHFVKGVRLRTGEMPLVDADGASLVVHAGADDRTTDPAAIPAIGSRRHNREIRSAEFRRSSLRDRVFRVFQFSDSSRCRVFQIEQAAAFRNANN